MELLKEIKVLDFSKWLPGQYCSMLLGDYGADVIKVEDLHGDATRNFWPSREESMSYWHLMLNRNKKGLCVDIKNSEGQKILLKLLKETDVFLEGFRPGYLKKYGLDYESVSKINPRIIYCSITGFGQNSQKPAHDLNVVGLAGLNSFDDNGQACVSNVQFSAIGSGLNALSAILMALYARERLHKGQYIDINLYATAISMQVTGISALWGCEETGVTPFGRTAHYYNIYKTKDDKYLTVGTIEPKFWHKLCDLLNVPELKERQFDFANENKLKDILAQKIGSKNQAEWLEIIGAEEFCVTPLNSLSNALKSELTLQEEMICNVNSDLGNLRYIEGPIKINGSRGSVKSRAPYLGEHNNIILQKLGYSDEEIKLLKANKII